MPIASCSLHRQLLDADGFATDIIDRVITRVVTPGTVTAEWLEDPGLISNLLAISPDTPDDCGGGGDGFATAWADVNAGKIFVGQGHQQHLADDLARISPVEVLMTSPRSARLAPPPSPKKEEKNEKTNSCIC